jgi:DNA-binding MarR family transcriptional regulator
MVLAVSGWGGGAWSARGRAVMTSSKAVTTDYLDRPDARPSDQELEALANFRLALRKFLAFSEAAAADMGLTMQWYQALLVIKTFPGDGHISVGELADQLMIRDHSAAELVSRLDQAKLVKRKTDPSDRRRSLILITPSGSRCLDRLALLHLSELRKIKGAFTSLFQSDGDDL